MPRKTQGKTTAKKNQRNTVTKSFSAKMPTRSVKAAKTDTSERDSSEETKSKKFLNKKTIIVVLVIAVVFLIFYFFRGVFVVATVNGQPISRLELIQELEQQGGKQALDTIVTKTLILQEARKKNIDVTETELNNELKKLEEDLKKNGQTLDQVLEFQGATREQYLERLKFQMIIEEILGKEVAVTDQEVEKYMTDNQQGLPTTAEATEAAQLRNSVKEQLRQQKMSEKVQEWLQQLQKEAKINYLLKF